MMDSILPPEAGSAPLGGPPDLYLPPEVIPDAAIEIVSDKRGDEEEYKMRMYARQRLQYYIIFDPDNILAHGVLRAFELVGRRYRAIEPGWLPDVGLGLTLWQGIHDNIQDT